MSFPSFRLKASAKYHLLILAVLLSFIGSCPLLASHQPHHTISKRASDDLKIVCYYSNWAVYRPGLAKFTPQNINPYLCTHLIYAFGGLSSKYELKAFDPYNDINQGNYKKFTGLKAYNDKLKTLIAIGGWNEGSKRFSKLVASPELRQTFIKSVLRFLREHNFDGLDLDWEYPGFRDGSTSDDKEGYAQLIKELRLAFDSERPPGGKGRLLLSVAVPAGQEYIDQGFDIPKISKDVDFLNILSYDYHTAYDPETDHHAPLSKRPEVDRFEEASKLNVEWTINHYVAAGAPKDKLILGIPTYGRSFTLINPESNGLGAPSEGPGEAGPSTREKGYLAYYEICQKVQEEGWQVANPSPKDQGPYAFKDNQWVGYDDIATVQEKAKYILENGLGGAMVWTLDNDDFRGLCSNEQSPIISALRSALLSNVVQGSSSLRANRLARPSYRATAAPTTTTTTSTTTTTTTTTRKPSRRNQFERNERTTIAPIREAIRTPEPPTTPDPGPVFECEDEGFFSNPKDCKKYFWCLDSGPANLGIVPHSFTCPSGLYFNTRSEACDYPDNVSCKNKNKDDTPKKKSSRNRSRATTTTTTTTEAPTTITTTEPPTTTIRTTTAPPISAELLAAALKLNEAQSSRLQPSRNDNLLQLLQLVNSLGGVDKIQSLLNQPTDHQEPRHTQGHNSRRNQNQNSRRNQETLNAVPDTRTTPSFFAPSYVTPNRHEISRVVEPQPQSSTRNSGSLGLPQNQVRPRRPQFDSDASPTPNPFFHYLDPTRGVTHASEPPPRSSLPLSPFAFSYNTPGGRSASGPSVGQPLTAANNPVGLQDPADFFNYNTPGRFAQSTRSTSVVTEAPFLRQTPPVNSDQIFRIPVRVSAGSVFRLPAAAEQPNATPVRRRPTRVRVQSAFAVADRPQPGVLYDEDPDQILTHPPPPPTLPPPPPHTVITTRRPIRRRPPQRPHLRNRPEENPVSALINLPPPNLPSAPVLQPLPRPLPPRPSPLRPLPRPASLPPRAGNIVTLPPRQETTTPFTVPAPIPFSGFRPIPSPRFPSFSTSSPRPQFDDHFATDFPFYDYPNTQPQPQTVPTTTSTTTTTTTTTTTPAPTTQFSVTRASRRRTRRPVVVQPQPQPVRAVTERPRRTQTLEPVLSVGNEEPTGPGIGMDTSGGINCGKRGVYAHPENCGQFVVCAPSSRGSKTYRPYTHHCPAEQVFVEEVGRCRPGNKERCEVFT